MRSVVGLLVLGLLASGCAGFDGDGANVAVIAGNGSKSGGESKSLECDEDGQVTVAVNGEGTIRVTVTDSAGRELYRDDASGNQEGESQTLTGAAGVWVLRATFSGPSFLGVTGGDYQGQWSITLTC